MNHAGFELYLKNLGMETEHEIREVISRASWVETTMDISLDRMAITDIENQEFKDSLFELIGSPEKTDDFYKALCSYMDFCSSQKTPHKK
ncbi:MAG: hypothetical protein D5S00_10735 [Tindallia sp. MSAO_Bac2]|nr:MAG: hypothetical protein D5S00_10735 [Tindallia sp. MSAO_Bac2]